MSSALSNLKKPRKVPLDPSSHQKPGQSVPFRDRPKIIDEDSQLLDEIASGMASERLHNVSLSSRPSVDSSVSHTPDDFQLMSSMMSRISQLEHQVQYQARESLDKDKKIKVLEEKTVLLKKHQNPDSGPSHSQELEKKCLMLQQQVHEMETFLADYGMVWVGEKDDEEGNVYLREEDVSQDGSSVAGLQSEWKPESSVAEFHMDYDLVINNIKELNVLAGDGTSKVTHTTDGARLRRQETIPLTLYNNGIMLFAGPFRSFREASTRRCMQDLMDGYFPSELEKRYPDGVPIQVTDKRTVSFHDRLEDLFGGTGQVLGGSVKPSRLVPSSLSHSPPTSVEHTPLGRKLTMEQFLNKVPASVVKGGKVIDIRKSLGEQLTGTSQGTVTVVDTPAAQELVNRLDAGTDESRPASSRSVTTLRVKSECGNKTYILKMNFSDSIGDVHKEIDKLREATPASYKLVSTFPQTSYTDLTATLKEANLVPNATLHIKPLKSDR